MTKKDTKTRPSRTEGPISDMDYHVIGNINDPEYQKILERLLKPKPETPPTPQPATPKSEPRKP